jgi:tRNA-specific 2-thiouridylase
MKRVVVGLSGGVDSSVSALLLKKEGYDVVGLFMRNWHEEDENGVCTAEEDYADVRRVAGVLDIPYYTVDLSKEYAERVFSLFLSEYKAGRTPNPDVLCNREIKFGNFKEYAKKLDAAFIATGHYAGTLERGGKTYLVRAKDENKDQTYFLNQVTNSQIQNVIFPLQNLLKTEVREIARKNNIPTAEKKDSTGVCFIGERDFRKFLSTYIPMKEGKIKTLDGKTVGTHSGVFYYTLGQRKGLGLGGEGEPWFVVKKDVEENVLYVSRGECEQLYTKELTAQNFNYITDKITAPTRVLARIRHRQPLEEALAEPMGGGLKITFDTPIRGVAAGQYAVIYKENVCMGGGVIE